MLDDLPVHRMAAEMPYPGETVFTCTDEACGRKVVVRRGSMVVLERGEFFAKHVGSTHPGLALGAQPG